MPACLPVPSGLDSGPALPGSPPERTRPSGSGDTENTTFLQCGGVQTLPRSGRAQAPRARPSHFWLTSRPEESPSSNPASQATPPEPAMTTPKASYSDSPLLPCLSADVSRRPRTKSTYEGTPQATPRGIQTLSRTPVPCV